MSLGLIGSKSVLLLSRNFGCHLAIYQGYIANIIPVHIVNFSDISFTNCMDMGRKAEVYFNDTVAGILEKVSPQFYVFRYQESYYNNPKCSAISLTMQKTQQEYQSQFLFPFFYGLLSEGDKQGITMPTPTN